MKSFTPPSQTGIIAAVLVGIGMILWMMVSKVFLIVAALGAFGPGILREFGWLKDQDEFKRHTAHRAGYHAYLAVGMLTAVLASVLSIEGQIVDDPIELIRSLLVLLWIAWMFSSLISFWGAQKTTATILAVFGSFWALFIILSLTGEDGATSGTLTEGILAVVWGLSLIAAFFLPVWTAHKWPKPTGVVLLIVASALFAFLYSRGSGNFQWTTLLLRDSMLVLPLVICGIALLVERAEQRIEVA